MCRYATPKPAAKGGRKEEEDLILMVKETGKKWSPPSSGTLQVRVWCDCMTHTWGPLGPI